MCGVGVDEPDANGPGDKYEHTCVVGVDEPDPNGPGDEYEHTCGVGVDEPDPNCPGDEYEHTCEVGIDEPDVNGPGDEYEHTRMMGLNMRVQGLKAEMNYMKQVLRVVHECSSKSPGVEYVEMVLREEFGFVNVKQEELSDSKAYKYNGKQCSGNACHLL